MDKRYAGYTRKEEVPVTTKDMKRQGQVWVWLNGAEIPHWEIRGTGLLQERNHD